MVENNNYFGIINGHFQSVLFFVSLILRLNFTYADHIILLLQSTILLIPFIFLKYKKNENAYLYLFFFPVWLINLNGFHTDSFIYPLFFLYLLEKEPKNKIFYCLSFILIKEIYLILTCLCLFEIIFLTKKRRKKLILSIFLILLILITGYFLAHILPKHSQQVTYFRSQEINQNQILIHSIIKEFYNYLKIIDLNKILYAALIFLPVLFIPLINKKFLFFYIPFFFIYTIIPGPNFLKPQFHYSTIFIPLILFFFTSSNIFNKKLGSFFLISNLLIIILSFANIGNLNLFRNYDFKNYVNIDNKNKLDLFFNDLTFNKEEVIATNNNLNYKYFFQRNLIIVQDLHGQDFLKSRELCKVLTEKQLKKAKKLSDKICEVYADKIFFTNNYISNLSNKEMNTVNKKYNIYKKNEIYTLYNTKK